MAISDWVKATEKVLPEIATEEVGPNFPCPTCGAETNEHNKGITAEVADEISQLEAYEKIDGLTEPGKAHLAELRSLGFWRICSGPVRHEYRVEKQPVLT